MWNKNKELEILSPSALTNVRKAFSHFVSISKEPSINDIIAHKYRSAKWILSLRESIPDFLSCGHSIEIRRDTYAPYTKLLLPCLSLSQYVGKWCEWDQIEFIPNKLHGNLLCSLIKLPILAPEFIMETRKHLNRSRSQSQYSLLCASF